jgi:hypothetical protein
MSIINSQPRIGAAGQSTGFKIERSLRFNSADSAYLNRTPASAGNRKTWTWSAWFKKSLIADNNPYLFSAGASAPYDQLYFDTNDKLNMYAGGNQIFLTNAVYRDPSAWYHIVWAVDTTQATSTDRIKLYVNGVAQTFATYNAITQNTDTKINNNEVHNIGRVVSNNYYLNGYLTEVYFIDGSAKTPSDFGETDTDTGVWKPKAYSGSYGTNGFFLKFADNSGTTSTTLGKDSSGNGNNWTPNNFSVTAGAGNDSLVDTPTPYGTDTGAGGEVRGNYCTLNPLKQTGATLTNGNLQFTKSGAASTLYTIHPTFFVSSGKWYFEMTPTAINSAGSLVGIVGPDVALTTYASLASMTGNIWAWRQDSYKVNNGSSSLYGNTWTANDVIGIAIDMDNGKIWWSKNGTWQASGDPAAGTNAAFTNVSGSVGPLLIDQGITATFEGSINAGQRPFAYTAPSGFKALCTTNLPTPTIGATATTRADDYFNAVLYTGTGSSLGVTGVGFQPDFVWIKERSGAADHGLYDAVRGVQKQLESNTTTAETTETTGLTAFNTDGFTVGALAQLNTNTDTYVAWNWKANGAGSSNTAGTISSTVSANTTAGFSIVTYTGNATAGATVGHGLGVTPSMIIVKDRVATSGAREWVVYHSSLGNTQAVFLNTTGTAYTGTNLWNNTSPTSTVFTIGNSSEGTNGSGNAMLAYCFAPIAGYSAFGSYTGNGSTDGPMVFTGFRPKFVLIKCSSNADYWWLKDSARNPYNLADLRLAPNLSDAESNDASFNGADFLSNGFKLRGSDTTTNGSARTYVYAAFAEVPQKFSLAR